jgi:hypothetical protein
MSQPSPAIVRAGTQVLRQEAQEVSRFAQVLQDQPADDRIKLMLQHHSVDVTGDEGDLLNCVGLRAGLCDLERVSVGIHAEHVALLAH